jgi:hypothetical protein
MTLDDEMIIRPDPAGKLKAYKRPKNAVSEGKIETFFEVLGMTSNVAEACRQAKLNDSTVYGMRSRDPEFRERWEVALEEGHVRLQMEMLHRARFGSEKTVTDSAEGKPVRTQIVHSYNDGLAMFLLKAHAATVEARRARMAALAEKRANEPTTEEKIERVRQMFERLPDEEAVPG